MEVSNDEKFIDINIDKADVDTKHVLLRAWAEGEPKYIDKTFDGVTYRTVEMQGKQYIPAR